MKSSKKKIGRVVSESHDSRSQNDNGSQMGTLLPCWIRDESNVDALHSPSASTSDSQISRKVSQEGSREESQLSLAQRIIKRQKTLLSQRAASRDPIQAQRKDLQRTAPPKTARTIWTAYIDSLDYDFFTSKEAMCDDTSPVGKGRTAYQGLRVNRVNCEDIATCFEIGWSAKEFLGHSTSTFSQFRICVGQLCRVSVALGYSQAEDLWRRGAVFQAFTDIDVPRILLNCFQISSAFGTVSSKASHMLTLARFCNVFFVSEKGAQCIEVGKLAAISQYLRSVCNANKKAARQQSKRRKLAAERTLTGKYMNGMDFAQFRKQAMQACEGVMISERGAIANGEKSILEKPVILQKWCINFLCLLMFLGCGQRPQVYSLLQRPQEIDLDELRRQCGVVKCFEMMLGEEKRERRIELPHVLLPKVALRFIIFHVKFVLPILYRRFKIFRIDPRASHLFLNTRTGSTLLPGSVTSTLRRWIHYHDPNFGEINAMTMRASYATVLIERHKEGKFLPHLSREKFVSYLALLMNTSEEQLSATYLASGNQDFIDCARIVANGLNIDNDYLDDSDSE